jgi:hypothetical protein
MNDHLSVRLVQGGVLSMFPGPADPIPNSTLTHHSGASSKLELELIQTQIAQKPMLRVEEDTRALRASQNVKRADVWWARDAPYGWAGRGRACIPVPQIRYPTAH